MNFNPYSRNQEEIEDPIQSFQDIIDVNNHEYDSTYLRSASGVSTVSDLPDLIDLNEALTVKQQYTVYNPIYKEEYLARCANAYLFDDIINAAVNRLAYFTLGTPSQFHSVLYPESIKPLKSAAEARAEMEKIKIMKTANQTANSIINSTLSDQEISDFESYVHYTNKVSKLPRFLQNNFIASHIFGRSACFVEVAKEKNESLGLSKGTPIGIKPLKPMHLGRIIIDKNTWDIEGLEYTDPTVNFKEYMDIGFQNDTGFSGDIGNSTNTRPKFLDIEKVLYFVRNNYNTMKEDNDFFFGHSTLQPILSMSEENRRMKEVVIPQLNQGHWAGSIIWKFPNWTQSMMKAFFRKIKPGGHTGVPQKDIDAQHIKFDYNYEGMIKLNEMLKQNILSVFGIPSFIMNIENANTKAVGEAVVIAFNESTIQYERAWITDILDEQWHKRLFKAYFPHDQHAHIKLKIQIEFENISFETFFEKAVAVVALLEKRLITLAEAREMLKLPPLKPGEEGQLGGVLYSDPNSQLPPQTPNLVEQLTKEQQANSQQPRTELDSRFNAKVNDLKNNVMPKSPTTKRFG